MNKRRVLFAFAGLLLAGGCVSDPSTVREKDGQPYGVTDGVFHGRWWSYYERGTSYLAGGFHEEAAADFEQALKGRSRDTWRARTYGLHFVEYFPVRELGVCYLRLGRLDDAERQLQEALAMVDTERAHAFLDEVKKEKIRTGALKDDTAPALAADMQPARIVSERELPVEVAVADDTGVAEVRVNEQKAFQRGSQTEIKVKETVELDEGTHEVTVTAVDLAGKETEQKTTVTVDMTGPTLGIYIPVEPTVTGDRTILLEGAAVDTNGVSRVAVDQRVVAESAGDPKLAFTAELPLAPGENTFVVASNDTAGNETRSALKVFQGDPESVEAKLWLRQQRQDRGGLVFASADAPQVLLQLAQEAAPAPEDGEIRLKSPLSDKPYRHSRALMVSGEVVGPQPLKSISINGVPVEPLANAPKESFTRRLPLETEKEGRFQVAIRAEDATGKVLEKSVDVEVRPVALNTVESRMPVAVLAFAGPGVDEGAAFALRAETEAAVTLKGRFRCLERAQLQQVLTEQQLAQALADPNQAIALGRLTNAQIFLTGELFPRDGKGLEVKLRVISTETSDIVSILDAFIADASDPAQVKQAAAALSAQLEAMYPKLSGEVMAVRGAGAGAELLLNWTKEDGVRQGAYLLLVNETPAWVDETTGEVLAPPEYVPVGRARIESPGDTGTRAKTLDLQQEGATIEKGMPAVTM